MTEAEKAAAAESIGMTILEPGSVLAVGDFCCLESHITTPEKVDKTMRGIIIPKPREGDEAFIYMRPKPFPRLSLWLAKWKR